MRLRIKKLQKQSLTDLKTDWDERLKESGFDDIESGPYLKRWDSQYFQRRYTPEIFEIKQDYYYMCELFLNEYGFDSRLDLEVWRLHSDGIAPEQIGSRLKAINIKTSTANAYNIIRRLERIMKQGLYFGD